MMVIKNIENLFEKPNMSAVVADASYPGNDYLDLNSGLMVITPEKGTSDRLISLIPNNTVHPMGDQDILQLGFPNWRTDKFRHLSEEYNVFANRLEFYSEKFKGRIKVVHFLGERKPWQYSGRELCWVTLCRVFRRRWRSLACLYRYRKVINDEMNKYKKYNIEMR